MSSIHLVTIEAALFMSAMSFLVWVVGKCHAHSFEVYSGERGGVQMSRRTRRLWLIYTYGGYSFAGGMTAILVGVTLLQIASSAAYPQAAGLGYLFAVMLLLVGGYTLISAVMTIVSLAKMIERGLRGAPA